MRFAAVLLAVVMLLMDPVRLLLSALLLTTLDACLQISIFLSKSFPARLEPDEEL